MTASAPKAPKAETIAAAGGFPPPVIGSGQALAGLLAQLPDGLLVEDGEALPDVAVGRVAEDSREAGEDTVFVAVEGLQQDGHRFIAQAVSAGAAAVVGSHPLSRLEELNWWPPAANVPYVQVTDSREALAWLSAALYGFPSRGETVIGVTGTDGKTTTCALLEAIIGRSADVGVITTVGARIAGVEQETGLHVTTPDAPTVQAFLAQMRSAGCGYAVVESTSFGLDQKRVAAVDYDVAALTNITHEHLDIHGSFEAYQAAKFQLFRSLFRSEPKPGVPRMAVFNLDDSSCQPLREALAEERARNGAAGVSTYIYSVADTNADVYARQIEYLPEATRFELVWPGGSMPMETRLIGEFNVSNVLCAAATALGLGIPPEQVQEGVASLPAVLGRMQRMDCGQAFLAVVDFAHSPASLERALETLRPLVAEDGGRLIAIFGCAGLRDRGKRRLMGQVSGRLADFTVITAEDPRTEDLGEINREIAAGVREVVEGADGGEGAYVRSDTGGAAAPGRQTAASSPYYVIVPDRAEAIRYGVEVARAGDVVASFGKGHERSMCYGETEYPWNEQEAMLSALRAMADRRGESAEE
ncbi:MAG: UDP-N-acetylmuramyl-tripeptide synthetase [Caldilineaceae bacterium]|nr:UDP-N-acetylmuramyl-tripeptide synthetase [Caldilineaceae bacterium]